MDQRDQDRLGRRGQTIVKGWLEESDVLPQTPEHDRLGWDFFAEFQPVRISGVALDEQDDLKKALIQVKATTSTQNSVRGKLSAFKALVDSDLPAFVVVLNLANGKEVRSAHLLHIGEDEIDAVLKKVREVEATGRTVLHRTKISLTLRAAPKIEPDGSNLAEEILGFIGPKTADYISKKAAYRRTCGYEEGSHTATINWTSSTGGKELVDLMLGYIPELKLNKFEVEKKRFGIALKGQAKLMTGGTLRVEPKPNSRVTLLIRNQDARASLEFDVFSPIPHVPTALSYGRLKNDFIDIKVHFGKSNLTFNSTLPLTGSYRIDLLTRVLKFLNLLSMGGSTLSIGDESAVLAQIDKPVLNFAKVSQLREFAEFLTLLQLKYWPDNAIQTNLEELAKLYWPQKGIFSLINATGVHNNCRIEGVLSAPPSKWVTLYFPVTLRCFDFTYGMIARIDSDDAEFETGLVTLPGSTVTRVHENCCAKKAFEVRTELSVTLRTLASMHAQRATARLILSALPRDDGTFDICEVRG
jgi:hypothetical protein